MKLKKLSLSFILALLFSFNINATATAVTTYRIQDINIMNQEEYIATFTPLFNDAPWMVEASSKQRPFYGFVDMYQNMITIIEKSDHAAQLALIKSHPRLACKSLRQENIATQSQSEQTGAGLNECSIEEAEYLQSINDQYENKFGYAFLLAIKGYDKKAIFVEIEDRINNSADDEFKIAMQQFYKILLMRMLDKVK